MGKSDDGEIHQLEITPSKTGGFPQENLVKIWWCDDQRSRRPWGAIQNQSGQVRVFREARELADVESVLVLNLG